MSLKNAMDLTRKKGKLKNFRAGCGEKITGKALKYPKHKLKMHITLVF
jgi:hypothetical protein